MIEEYSMSNLEVDSLTALLAELEKRAFHQDVELAKVFKKWKKSSSKIVKLKKDMSTVDKIVRQVEYYFCDDNLDSDEFMMELIGKSVDGFVDLKVIAGFKKLKRLSKNMKGIAKALRKKSKAIIVNDKGNKIRRAEPHKYCRRLFLAKRNCVVASRLGVNQPVQGMKDKFLQFGEIQYFCVFETAKSKPNDILLTKIGCGDDGATGKEVGAAVDVEPEGMIKPNTSALVVYTKFEAAQSAVNKLGNNSNWRSGMRVIGLSKGLKRRKEVSPISARKNNVGFVSITPQKGSAVDRVLAVEGGAVANHDSSGRRTNRLSGAGSLAALLGERPNNKTPVRPKYKLNRKKGFLLDIVGLDKGNVANDKMRIASAPDGTRGFSANYMESRGLKKKLSVTATEWVPMKLY